MVTRLLLSIATITAAVAAAAEDWPTFMKDNRRSGVTPEALALPLESAWTWQSPAPPQMAWEGPAKWDAYSGNADLKSMHNFDPAFFVTAVGDAIYFGSSADDAVHCLDADSGAERWAYYTEGPVRVPPTLHEGRAYFGSDDGYVYCVNAATGAFEWKYKPISGDRLIPVNGKVISEYPCRTGVIVQNGTLYFGNSLMPWNPSYLCAIKAAPGAEGIGEVYRHAVKEATFQGAMLASDNRLYALQGRSSPMVFDLETGKRRTGLKDSGGAYALLTEDNSFFAQNSEQKDDIMRESTASGRDQLATYEGANRILVSGGVAYLQSPGELARFNRAQYLDIQAVLQTAENRLEEVEKSLKTVKREEDPEGFKALSKERRDLRKQSEELLAQLPQAFVWRKPIEMPHALILAGDTLYAGGTNQVAAINSETGDTLWTAPTNGAAHGLTIANGHLHVSTDQGTIHTFRPKR